ncbi:MAG: UDP-N-acetylmuramoyl-tripeptide--D-alanyl-D-alanine ligase [Sorangiineae bacterium]|nr:UDP-N-acetylmuramoyl-tripeptide--D-alanyl-D-alanine ligase [Polyangiaceae bacterium]MEB2322745.1 UDP-N-acetylmuramoyl-tripeptide--D-alanyl-D-alanine ligase [Sorangiineae bacterium]
MATEIPQNRAAFSLDEVLRASSGRLLGEPGGDVRGVATDTRASLAGKLFVALRGERFDGHDFLDRAVGAGAAALLVEREPERDLGVPVVLVDSSLAALGALAGLYRKRWGGTVVAVGGSAGKTTTRSAITAVLDEVMPGAVHYARGNLNNRVGVPMVLFGALPEHRVVVLEIGTNQPGEVAALARASAPELAVVTLIGMEHAEGLGDLDAIEAEEGELFAALPASGVAVGNGDDPRVRRQLARSPAATRVTYGTHAGSSYLLARRAPRGLASTEVEIERAGGSVVFEAALIGEAGALAVTAALAVAERLTARLLDAATLARAFAADRVGEPGRLRPVELSDGTVLIDDTYNSNPASVLASVATAREIARERGARLILVLGEMRELGAASAREHDGVGRALLASEPAVLVGVAGDAHRLVAPAQAAGCDAVFVEDAESALPEVLGRVRSGDVVLVKASRGVRAERVVEGLARARGGAA